MLNFFKVAQSLHLEYFLKLAKDYLIMVDRMMCKKYASQIVKKNGQFWCKNIMIFKTLILISKYEWKPQMDSNSWFEIHKPDTLNT